VRAFHAQEGRTPAKKVRKLRLCSLQMNSRSVTVSGNSFPPLVWLDLEMTGLNPESCAIVELALIVTDTELKPLGPPLELAIWQPESVLERMTPFVRELHTRTGLLDKIRRSQLSLAEAEQEALRIVSKHAAFRTARLCGNSIHTDRTFLVRHMPALENFMHYRQIDVSALKELGHWWYGYKYRKPTERQHTALYDVQQSIEELKAYRKHILRRPEDKEGPA
jgi:oligoribonuclease